MVPVTAEALLLQDDPYTLVVAPDAKGAAEGELYADDGKSFAFQRGVFASKRFRCGMLVAFAQASVHAGMHTYIPAHFGRAICMLPSLAHHRVHLLSCGCLWDAVHDLCELQASSRMLQSLMSPGFQTQELPPHLSTMPAALWGAPRQMRLH